MTLFLVAVIVTVQYVLVMIRLNDISNKLTDIQCEIERLKNRKENKL